MLFHELIEPLQNLIAKHLLSLCPYLTTKMARQYVDTLFAQLIFVYYKQILYKHDMEINMSNSDISKMLEHIISFTLAGIRNYETIR